MGLPKTGVSFYTGKATRATVDLGRKKALNQTKTKKKPNPYFRWSNT